MERMEGMMDAHWEHLEQHHLNLCAHWAWMDLMMVSREQNPIIIEDDSDEEEDRELEMGSESLDSSGLAGRAL